MSIVHGTPGRHSKPVTARHFGTGDGVRTVFNLSGKGIEVAHLAPDLYLSDWGGNQLLYSTARTNRQGYSSTGQSWTVIAATALDLAVTGPDGTISAWTLTENGANTLHYTAKAPATLADSTAYCASIYVRQQVGTRNLLMYLYDKAAAQKGVVFNLGAGTVDSYIGGTSGGIQNLGGGWFRCWFVFNSATGANTPSLTLMMLSGSTSSYLGDSTSALAFYNAQVELGSVPTYPIVTPLSATPVTVTDYTLHATSGLVTLASAPVAGATLAYKQPWAPSTNVFMRFGTGDGSSTTFSLPFGPVTPVLYDNGATSNSTASTNTFLQSNAFTTTWFNNGTPASVKNQTDHRGIANNAWLMTDNSAAGIEGPYQMQTLTAALWTMSLYVKKTTGAQASYPIINAYTGSTIALATIDTTNGVATVWTAFTGFSIRPNCVGTCVDAGGGFWRVSLTFTATAASYQCEIVVAGTTNATQSTGTRDNTAQGTLVCCNAQMQQAASMGDYVQTTTTSATGGGHTIASNGAVTYGTAPESGANLTFTGAVGPMP